MRLLILIFLLSELFFSKVVFSDSINQPIKNNLVKNKLIKNKPIKKIIALAPHSVEILFSIGAGDRIVATVEYADYPKAALNIPRIGNHTGIQIERVVELQPDLIVTSKTASKQSDLDKLESLGFNIFFTNANNVHTLTEDIIELGRITGLTVKSRAVVEKIKQDYSRIKARYTKKPLVKVFYQVWHQPLRTVSKDSWIDTLIKDCQGDNLFSQSSAAYPMVSIEDVLVKNPNVIIIPHHSGSVGAKTEYWNTWKKIDAVENEQIHTINGDILHRLAPRIVQGLEKLCEAIDQARKE